MADQVIVRQFATGFVAELAAATVARASSNYALARWKQSVTVSQTQTVAAENAATATRTRGTLVWLRQDGSDGTSLYVKEAGTETTGWVPKGSPAAPWSADGHRRCQGGHLPPAPTQTDGSTDGCGQINMHRHHP